MITQCLGCKIPIVKEPELDVSKFNTTDDKDYTQTVDEKRTLQMSFDKAPFGVAMSTITTETGVPICWAAECDETIVSGVYNGNNIYDVLTAIARRNGFRLTKIGDMYFLGQQVKGDNYSAVIRSPSCDITNLQAMLSNVVSETGSVSINGGVIVATDDIDHLQKFVSVVNQYRDLTSRGYVAEVYFMRMSNKDLLDLQAKLEVSGIDLLSSTITLSTLFNLYLDSNASSKRVHIDNRPVLYLSEGRKTTFSVGSDITMERKSISSEGYSTTTGYQKFSDGLNIDMTCNRISKGLYSVDFNLTVSKFSDSGDVTKGIVPQVDKSALMCPGILVKDGGVLLVGSLSQKEINRGYGIFTVSGGKNDEIITIWLRLRELNLEK